MEYYLTWRKLAYIQHTYSLDIAQIDDPSDFAQIWQGDRQRPPESEKIKISILHPLV